MNTYRADCCQQSFHHCRRRFCRCQRHLHSCRHCRLLYRCYCHPCRCRCPGRRCRPCRRRRPHRRATDAADVTATDVTLPPLPSSTLPETLSPFRSKLSDSNTVNRRKCDVVKSKCGFRWDILGIKSYSSNAYYPLSFN